MSTHTFIHHHKARTLCGCPVSTSVLLYSSKDFFTAFYFDKESGFTCSDILKDRVSFPTSLKRKHQTIWNMKCIYICHGRLSSGDASGKVMKGLFQLACYCFLNCVMKRHISLICISIASSISFSQQEVVSGYRDESLRVPDLNWYAINSACGR